MIANYAQVPSPSHRFRAARPESPLTPEFRNPKLDSRAVSFCSLFVKGTLSRVSGGTLKTGSRCPLDPKREFLVDNPRPETRLPVHLESQERELFVDNLLVRIHLNIEMILVDRPCDMGV